MRAKSAQEIALWQNFGKGFKLKLTNDLGVEFACFGE
jgi:hypothetical protein